MSGSVQPCECTTAESLRTDESLGSVSSRHMIGPQTDVTAYESLLPSTLASVGPLARSVMSAMDLNKPVGCFSEEEAARVQMAAHLLHSCRFNDEAFRLHALLLKRDRVGWLEHDHRTCHRAFIAAHAAMMGQDGVTPQNLLRHERDNALRTGSALEAFLAVMLLSDCKVFTWRQPYGSEPTDGNAEHFIRWASLPASTLGSLLEKLPDHDRSLDLLTWYQLVRLQAPPGPKLLHLRHHPSSSDYNFGRVGLVEDWSSWAVHEYTDTLLQRRPGPFELVDSTMQNPCLRQCLASCHEEIQKYDTAVAVPEIWKLMEREAVTSKNSKMAGPSRVRCYEVASVAMFVHLWGVWAGTGRFRQTSQMPWIEQAERRMGIPPTELLVMVCHMICDAGSLWKPVESDHSLSPSLIERRLQSGVQRLVQATDEELAREFLGCFHRRNSLVPWPNDVGPFPRVPPSIAQNLLQRALGLPTSADPDCLSTGSDRRPSLVRDSTDLCAPGSRGSFFGPSMAASLSSSDYSRFADLRDRIGRINRSSMSVVSRLTISSMSDYLGRYLNLSPARTREDAATILEDS